MLNTAILAGTAVIAFSGVFGYIIGKMSAHAHKMAPEAECEHHGCGTCKHKDARWDEEPCDSCCEAHDGWEAIEDGES